MVGSARRSRTRSARSSHPSASASCPRHRVAPPSATQAVAAQGAVSSQPCARASSIACLARCSPIARARTRLRSASRERLELQDWPADSPALLQPLFEVSFGCLELTRPHLGGPEFDQRRCPKTFVANPRPDRTWTVGQLEQSPRLFGDSVQIVAGPREPQPHEHERKLEAPPAFFGHRGRLALRQRQIPLSLLQ